jgi:hypothetical protein
MKIYCCESYDNDLGKQYKWFASKHEAEVCLRTVQRERGTEVQEPENVRMHIINPNRSGILQWLNTNFTSANG